MVEYTFQLDSVFGALADPTRRDILRRVATKELSVGEVAGNYELSFAAISKHLKVLEKAKMIVKRRHGKQQFVALSPSALKSADDYLEWYRKLWEDRLDALDKYLKEAKG
ncbi:MAG TPA: metalloregulator ArsR/SmtB family transcription factor [Candidatus Saccharimonadales bacterium]|nr:metalloregulator ArsR/SmtB family transcription factor [Candidatus Saccharimonadales bacterium]